MSELINNRKYRKKKIRELIQAFKEGHELAELKKQFAELAKDIAPIELVAIEQQLINEGLSREDIHNLGGELLEACKDALDKTPEPQLIPGHPIHTFMQENRALEQLIDEVKTALANFLAAPGPENMYPLREKLNLLWDIEKHFSRKENILFPFLEKYEITGPSRIMWTQDDEIRDLLKEVKRITLNFRPELKSQLAEKTETLLRSITAMIAKEENILFKTALKVLTEDEWYKILQDSDEIGYCLIEPEQKWRPFNLNITGSVSGIEADSSNASLKFATGVLTAQEINLIFNNLPVDITYVDKEGVVKFFSANKDRIFVRSRSIIGRRVENCHPPASVEIVEKLIDDLASGRKDHEDFWLHLGDKYVFIRYLALRDEKGDFVGVLECTQDIKPLQAVQGEKRIAD